MYFSNLKKTNPVPIKSITGEVRICVYKANPKKSLKTSFLSIKNPREKSGLKYFNEVNSIKTPILMMKKLKMDLPSNCMSNSCFDNWFYQIL